MRRPALLAVLVLAAVAPAAQAAPAPTLLPAETVLQAPVAIAAGTTDVACQRSFRPGAAGVGTRTVDAAGVGSVDVDALADGGDVDVAVFDTSGELVVASASPDAQETASGFLARGDALRVQVCRLAGDAKAADVTVRYAKLNPAAEPTDAHVPQLVSVSTPTRADKATLTALGLDLTEHGGIASLGVVLHGEADRRALRRTGLSWRVLVPDMVRQDVEARTAERRATRAGVRSALPSGRTSYRRLGDYESELKALAKDNPGLVKLITLPNKTWSGKDVLGIEIATNVEAKDGRPAFFNMGVHHAREWPSGEAAMEWAVELVKGARAGDRRTLDVVRRSRNIVVPVVNPDGFEASREAGELAGQSGGRNEAVPDTAYLVAGAATGGEYRRKNCRLPDNSDAANCATSVGIAETGVDPNRNYGGLWGGPGADTDPTTQTYRGPGPFSEPESRNVQAVVSANQVMSLITNHTTAGLLLRAPGLLALGDPVDEQRGYKALGDAMARHNGYFSQKSFELYDTTGTTEDWAYNATGAFGFTLEIYCGDPNYTTGDCDDPAFHPSFEAGVRKEWDGDSDQANHVNDPGADKGFDGRGNREVYFIAAESAIDESRHSVLTGEVPAGVTLRLKKAFKTKTFPQPQAEGADQPIEFDDALETTYEAPAGGTFRWNVNPSTRPIVAKESGVRGAKPPSPKVDGLDGAAGADPRPCPDYYPADDNVPSTSKDDPTCWKDHPFTFPVTADATNDGASVRFTFGEQDDWDLEVYEDVDGDGVSNAAKDKLVAMSGNGATSGNLGFEELSLPKPSATTKYVARMINFAAVGAYQGEVIFNGPPPFEAAKVESYTLTCERGGQVLLSQPVTIDRGRIQSLAPCTRAGVIAEAPTVAGGGETPAPTPAAPIGGSGGSTPDAPAAPGGGGTTSAACTSGLGFASVGVTPSGTGAKLAFTRRTANPVTVSVFQQSAGRTIVGERLVARFGDRAATVAWDGKANRPGRKVVDGVYLVRYAMAGDVRRVVLERINGRFKVRGTSFRRAACDALKTYKLGRPVFGGTADRALTASFRLATAGRVTVTVLRGTKVVRTFGPADRAANVTHRLRLAAKGLARGEYTVRISVGALTTTLTARRL